MGSLNELESGCGVYYSTVIQGLQMVIILYEPDHYARLVNRQPPCEVLLSFAAHCRKDESLQCRGGVRTPFSAVADRVQTSRNAEKVNKTAPASQPHILTCELIMHPS